MSRSASTQEKAAASPSRVGELSDEERLELVRTRALALEAERIRVVERWLLTAADDSGRARAEWPKSGRALLRVGTLFNVVRIDARLVQAFARSTSLAELDACLAWELRDGPVLFERHAGHYYVLLGLSERSRPEWESRSDDVEFMGRDHRLGVPPPSATDPDSGPSYWSVPIWTPGALTKPYLAGELIARARSRLARERQSGE
ncbi:hypothetical protein AB0F77_09520 [Streptomyces sp. NPDC026672]|uniref:hypothetical protein n=1 Tax=unclassified Streptomyces TaxID=2593676 RepID=UPI0033DF79CC